MHADREAHQVGDQHDPARRMRPVGILLPLEHEPHDERREHRRKGVDLALDGREPEGVGEGVGQRPDGSGAQHGPDLRPGQLAAVARRQTPCEVGDRPEEEEDAEGAGERVHGVHRGTHVVGIAERKERRQTRQHHEERRSGRVSHFELIGGGDEFRAVPEARNRLHSHQIDRRRHGENGPTDDVVPAFKQIHRRSVRILDCVLLREMAPDNLQK